jgi:hypothetical protein
MIRLITGTDPLERGNLEARRTLTVEFLGQSIFTDREHGARVAARVLASTPMPAHGGVRPRPTPELRSKNTVKVRHL